MYRWLYARSRFGTTKKGSIRIRGSSRFEWSKNDSITAQMFVERWRLDAVGHNNFRLRSSEKAQIAKTCFQAALVTDTRFLLDRKPICILQ